MNNHTTGRRAARPAYSMPRGVQPGARGAFRVAASWFRWRLGTVADPAQYLIDAQRVACRSAVECAAARVVRANRIGGAA